MRAAVDAGLSRRDALKATIASVGLSALAFETAASLRAAEPERLAAASAADARRGSPRRSDVLKSINLWAFPSAERMNLHECLQAPQRTRASMASN